MNRRERRAEKKRARATGGKAGSAAQALADAAALFQEGRYAAAAKAFEGAASHDPKNADARYGLGVALRALGQVSNAADAFREVLDLRPDHFEATVNLAVSLQDCGRNSEALDTYHGVLDIKPDFAEAHLNIGLILRDRGELDAAMESLKRALFLKPEYPPIQNAIGTIREALRDLEGALEAFDRALLLDPVFAEAHNNRANVLKHLDRFDDAKAAYRRAIELRPDYAEAHRNYAHTLLMTGDFGHGWRELEWRWRCRDFPSRRRPFDMPGWRGEDLSGKTVLVWSEQGVGDEINHAGMVPDLTEAGAQVILECDPRLVPVFARSFPLVEVVGQSDPPAEAITSRDIDFQIPLASLGLFYRRSEVEFPDRLAYLKADLKRRDALRAEYGGSPENRLIGVSWRSANPEIGSAKSMSVSRLAPLACIPGVRLIDLQYGDTEAERAQFEMETGMGIHRDPRIDQFRDMDAFTNQVAAMDGVVSISSTCVHAAGALGIPTWVMLHTEPLMCWMLEREDSPWYPSVRLIRQRRPGDWDDVVERAAASLSGFLGPA